MIGFNAFNILSFTIILILHIDSIYNLCFSKLWYLNLQTKERKLLKQKTELSENQTGTFWLYFIYFLIFITKFSQQNYYNLFTYLIICCMLSIFTLMLYTVLLYKKTINNFKFLNLIFQVIIFIFFALAHVNNFLSLFFFMELLAICYYFFFLTSLTTKIQSHLNQMKNLLILYLWNSFFTSLLFALFLILLLYKYGTINFSEIFLLWKVSDWYITYIFFFSLLLKLGLPLMHFIKLQIYNFFDWNLVFFYSVITTLVNFSFLLIISTYSFFLLFLQNISLMSVLLFANIFTVINMYRAWTLLNFLLFSIVTTSIVFIVILF